MCQKCDLFWSLGIKLQQEDISQNLSYELINILLMESCDSFDIKQLLRHHVLTVSVLQIGTDIGRCHC